MLHIRHTIRRWLPSAIFATIAISPWNARAVVIDDFETGGFAPFVITAPQTGDTFFQSDLPTEHVLSGRRFVQLSLSGPTTPGLQASAVLDLALNENNGIEFESNTDSFFQVDSFYFFDLGLDLNSLGGDRFEVVIPDAIGTGDLHVFLRDTNNVTEFLVISMLDAPGTYYFPFADIQNVDSSQIFQLGVGFSATGPAQIEIADFNVIPEPSTATLLALGLLGLSTAGRRRAAARPQ
jgi:hypothetical protein